jgi:cytochrome oxidase Cu insertion factor (SCO1/SenC/PrrC family)
MSPLRRLRLGALLTLLALSGCVRQPPSDPETPLYIPDFNLTERSGRTVSKTDLEGTVWIGASFYATCPGVCTQVSGAMARLQKELANQPDVRLVSVTLDPETDTPAVLESYATKFGADPKRWLFLTGPKDQVLGLIEKGFRVGFSENTGTARASGDKISHNPRLVLVDRTGRIRGWFDATDSKKLDDLVRQVLRLVREKPA